MIVESSKQVPRATLLRRFPVPKNFGLTADSRIGRGKTWPKSAGASRVKTLAIYRFDQDSEKEDARLRDYAMGVGYRESHTMFLQSAGRDRTRMKSEIGAPRAKPRC